LTISLKVWDNKGVMEVPKREKRTIEDRQWAEIKDYLRCIEISASRKLSERTIENNTRYLYDLAVFAKPSLLSELPKEKIQEYLHTKMQTDADTTHTMRKVTIKRFYINLGQEEKVRDITTHMPRTSVIEEDLPTEEEFIKLLTVLKRNPQTYALVSLLIETGCRPGEVAKLKRKSIQDKGTYFELTIREGKTGPRRGPLPIIESGPALRRWINIHPYKNPDAPLFFARYEGKIKFYDTPTIGRILTNACKMAGIRHHSPKQWRHRAATMRARAGWPQPQLCEYFGWSPTSSMASVYIHNAGSLERALEDAGLKPKEEHRRKPRIKVCQYCGQTNDIISEYCDKCGGNLNVVFSTEEIAIEQRGIKEAEMKIKWFNSQWGDVKSQFIKPDSPPILEIILRDAVFSTFLMAVHQKKVVVSMQFLETHPDFVKYFNLDFIRESLIAMKGQKEIAEEDKELFELPEVNDDSE
jgi:integrase